MKKADLTMTAEPVNSAAAVSADTAGGRCDKRAAAGLAMLGLAVVALDAQITNVALPAIQILDGVPGQLAGTASDVLNTFRQMGGSLGVAIVNASSAFEHGLRVSFAGTALLVAIAAAGMLAVRKYSSIR